MKNQIYMNVSITYFGNGRIECCYDESIDDAPITIRELDIDTARRMMWELVLAGGHRDININRYDRDIIHITTYLFLDN